MNFEKSSLGAGGMSLTRENYTSNIHDVNSRLDKILYEVREVTRSLRCKNDQLMWPAPEVTSNNPIPPAPIHSELPLLDRLANNITDCELAVQELHSVVSRTLTI